MTESSVPSEPYSASNASPRAVDVPAVLDAVHEDGGGFVVDLKDDPVVATPGRPEPSEFTDERLADATGLGGEGAEHQCKGRVSHLVGQPVQVAKTLRRDVDLVRGRHSGAVAEGQSLSLGGFAPRSSDRCGQVRVPEDVEGLLERLQVVGAYE